MTSGRGRAMPPLRMFGPCSVSSRRFGQVHAALVGLGVFFALSHLAESRPSDGRDEHGVRFESGFPVTRPDELYPLSRVARGQTGVGYTVFEADRLETFGVEILGVMEGMLGPGEDVVLARLTGDRIAFTGVIAGMSGSPVYIDGKLLGAVAYRFGSFTKEPIAGITPIERMLPLFEQEDRKSRQSRRPNDSESWAAAVRDRGRSPGPGRPMFGLQGRGSSGTETRPIATVLSASGLHPAAMGRLSSALEPLALEVTPAGSGPQRGRNGPSSAGKVPAAPIRPGAPIAALLTRGDVNLSAIGTVTYVHEDQVLGFGHPFVGHGNVGFPLATASIINTLASEAGSYKQGLAALEVGVVSQDRLTAISGRLGGPPPPLVPIAISVKNRGGPPMPRRSAVEVVDDAAWLPMLTDTVVSSALLRRIGAEPGGTVYMKAGIEVNGRFLEVEDSYAAPAPINVAAHAARDVAVLMAILSRNDLEPASIGSARVDLEVDPEVKIFALESASVYPREVRPGEEVFVKARLRPYRGVSEDYTLRLRMPRDAPEGAAHIFVGGGLELDRRDADARGALEPRSLDALLGILAERRPAQALYARAYFAEPGLRIGTEVHVALPPSARIALSLQPDLLARDIDERPGPSVRMPFDGVVEGGRALTVDVRSSQRKPKDGK